MTRKLFISLLWGLLAVSIATADTYIPGGYVSGTWTAAGSPYHIQGIITIHADSTLNIQPGVQVDFQGSYYMTVNGFLNAIGSESDSILFTSYSTSWCGISFENAPDSSRLEYCIVQNVYDDVGPNLLGAIKCQNSNPLITHCRISDNAAAYPGFDCAGGISLFNSSPEISWCNIRGNEGVSNGGGINCNNNSSPAISYCEIRDNRTDTLWGARGGGINARVNSNPIVMNCVIEGNTSYEGGGIAIEDGNCTITDCTIIRNLVAGGGSGGGIWIVGGNMSITGCTVDSNCVIYDYPYDGPGGGIYADCGTLTIDHCTFNDNYSGDLAANVGSAVHLAGNTLLMLTNTIIRGPRKLIVFNYNTPATVSYNDFILSFCLPYFVGGPPGLGELTQVNANGDSCDVYFNIFLDPVFVGLYNQDYNLRWRSPCIDAGDPNSPLDPDNTVCDMGPFYFNQDAMGVVELYPHVTVIPPEGGQLVYDGWVFNFIGYPGRADIWTYAFVPGVGRYGPIDLYRNFRIPPDSIGMNNIRQNVPGLAPGGDYVLAAYVGVYPSTIVDSSYFYFSKEGSVAGEIGDWSSSGLLLKAGDETTFDLPSHYVVSQNYPNPFNASTTISYQVPVDGHVKLEVYNTLGQRVATLVDSKQQAGYKSVIWDASDVSSGLYFYKLTAGDFTETRRMMLVK